MKKYLSAITWLSATMLFFLCCCISRPGYAQTNQDLLRAYDSASIHSIGKFYIKGSRKIKFGDLKPEFSVGTTKILYRKAKADRVWGGLLTITSVTALVTGIVVRKNNTTLGNVLSGCAIALNLGGLHFSKRSTELTDRAIWLRNREILFGIRQ